MHLGQFAEVLGCSDEVELVFCSVGTKQKQAVELPDSLEVPKQHLDLLSLVENSSFATIAFEIRNQCLETETKPQADTRVRCIFG